MQKKTLQKTLSGSAKKSRQTTGEEPRRSARQSTQSGGARATYTSLPTKEKAEYVRDLTDRYYRSQRAAETAAKRAESAVRSGGAGSSTHYGSSGRAHGGSSGSFPEPSLFERRQQQKADARREILRRSFDLLGTAAVQSQSAASGYYASPSQQLALARRQADNVQAIKEANARFNEANRVIDWDGRSALVSELEDLDRNAGWEISEEQANAAERRRQLLLEKLRAGDLAAGNGIRSGTDADTGRDIVESTAKGIGGASVDLFSNIGKHLERMDTYSWKATDTFSDLWNGQPLGTSRRERIQAYEDPASQEKWKRIDAAADRLSGDSAAVLQRAKEGKSFLGEIGVDAAKSALEMGFDSGVALATGGSALIPMGARVYGQSVGKARRAGANLDRQTAYAMTRTAIELASEKLFDGVAGIYGAGAADDITEALVRRLADSDTGRTLLRAVIGSVGEGTEELVSDLLDPLAEAMVRDESVGELYRQLDPADMLYDYLIGSTIGLFGSGADIAAGRNAEANRTLKDLDTNEAAYLRRMEEIGHLRPEGDKNAALDGAAESTVINTDPAKHTTVEQAVIDEYQNAVDEKIKSQILKARSIQNETYRNKYSVTLSLSVGEQVIALVKNATGLDISGYKNILKGNALRHIDKRHGENGRADHSLADINDLSRINYVIENADGAALLTKDDVDSETWRLSREYNNADNTPAPLIRFYKAVNGTYYVVEAVPDSAAHRIAVVSAYMKKAKEKSESSTD